MFGQLIRYVLVEELVSGLQMLLSDLVTANDFNTHLGQPRHAHA